MTPQDVFIQHLLAQGLISPEHLQKACEIQRQEGGDLVNILFEILARQRQQQQFRQSISQQGLPCVVMQTQSSEHYASVMDAREPALVCSPSQNSIPAVTSQHAIPSITYPYSTSSSSSLAKDACSSFTPWQSNTGRDAVSSTSASSVGLSAGGQDLKKMVNAFQTVVGVELPPDALQNMVKTYQTVIGVELSPDAFQELVKSYDALYEKSGPSPTSESIDRVANKEPGSGSRDGIVPSMSSLKPAASRVAQAIENRYSSDSWAASDVVYTPLVQGSFAAPHSGQEPYRIKSYDMLDAVAPNQPNQSPSRELLNKTVLGRNRRSDRSEHEIPSLPRIGSALKSLSDRRGIRSLSSRSLQEIPDVSEYTASSNARKWMVLGILGLVLLTLLIGGALRYHTWLTRLLP